MSEVDAFNAQIRAMAASKPSHPNDGFAPGPTSSAGLCHPGGATDARSRTLDPKGRGLPPAPLPSDPIHAGFGLRPAWWVAWLARGHESGDGEIGACERAPEPPRL